MGIEENIEMFSDGVDGIRTTRMLERAVKNRWPIPDKYKEAIINRQVKIAISQKSTARESASAARTILAADKLNIEQEKLEQPQQHLHLHQASDQTIDLSKLDREKLEELEQILLAAQNTKSARSAEPVIEGIAVPIH